MFAGFAGLAMGLVHVLSGPDHLAAVAPLSADTRGVQWRAGMQWGLGHTAGVMLIGLLLVFFRHWLPLESISAHSERLVGIALLAVGTWGVLRAGSPRPHTHRTSHASFGMGALHGVAGSSHVYGVLPALALPTEFGALAYVVGYGAGAVLAMTAFSALIGVIAVGAARRGLNAYRGVLYACSISAFLVGGLWLIA